MVCVFWELGSRRFCLAGCFPAASKASFNPAKIGAHPLLQEAGGVELELEEEELSCTKVTSSDLLSL